MINKYNPACIDINILSQYYWTYFFMYYDTRTGNHLFLYCTVDWWLSFFVNLLVVWKSHIFKTFTLSSTDARTCNKQAPDTSLIKTYSCLSFHFSFKKYNIYKTICLPISCYMAADGFDTYYESYICYAMIYLFWIPSYDNVVIYLRLAKTLQIYNNTRN